MKKLLVPVDFRAKSENALDWALKFGKIINAKIELVHFYLDPEEAQSGAQNNLTITNATAFEEAKDRLQALLSRHSSLDMDCFLLLGYPDRQIVEVAKELDADMIVMSSHLQEFEEPPKAAGNCSLVVQYAECPVVVIPPDYEWQDIKMMGYASALHDDDMDKVQHLLPLASLLGSDLIAANIKTPETKVLCEEDLGVDCACETAYQGSKLVSIKCPTVHEGLLHFLDIYHIDFLVMMMERNEGIVLLENSSETLMMIRDIAVPLLILHTNTTELKHFELNPLEEKPKLEKKELIEALKPHTKTDIPIVKIHRWKKQPEIPRIDD